MLHRTSLALLVLLSGCVAPPKARLDLAFDAEHARRLMLPGTNIIRGSALLRQAGGGVVTCAGSEVFLIPATEYADRRMQMIYKGKSLSRGLTFESTPPGYFEISRATRCNAQGFFAFDRVGDGHFYVVTTVAWKAGYSIEGGALMQKVSPRDSEVLEIVLTSD